MSVERRVVFLILPTVQILDLAGPAQAFSEAQGLGASYPMLFAAPRAQLRSSQGIGLAQLVDFESVSVTEDDLILIPGISGDRLTPKALALSGRLVRWLQDAHEIGATIGSVCNAAFVLAEAGLLDGRTCTTHWRRTRQLAETYAAVQVLENRLFVKDRGIYSSAGICSGIDLALSIIEEDHGPAFTARVAKGLVLYLRRDSHHSQLSTYLDYRNHLNPAIHTVQEWIVQHLDSNPTTTELAEIGSMSVRNLSRVFRKETGLTIKEYMNKIRLEHASVLMNDPKRTIDAISRECGFEHPRQLRRLWSSVHHAPPGASRKSAGAAGSAIERRRLQ